MKALSFSIKKLKVKDIPEPLASKHEALVKVIKAGICNTDLELVKGYMNFKGVLGHEFVGQVVQAPRKSWIGKRVVGEINLSCGNCEFCLNGKEKHCPTMDILGIYNKNGAFAEYLTLPLVNLHTLPQSISNTETVFVEPLAAYLEIFEQISIGTKETVLILGDGKLGLLVAQVMKLKTDKVYCLGRYKRKLEILKKREIKTFLSGDRITQRFDVVVEATGKEEGLKEALLRIQPRGKIVLKSTFKGGSRVDISKIMVDEIQVIGSRCGPFLKAIDILNRKLIDVEEMVDGDFPLHDAVDAFALAQKPGIIKVLITI